MYIMKGCERQGHWASGNQIQAILFHYFTLQGPHLLTQNPRWFAVPFSTLMCGHAPATFGCERSAAHSTHTPIIGHMLVLYGIAIEALTFHQPRWLEQPLCKTKALGEGVHAVTDACMRLQTGTCPCPLDHRTR